METGGRLAIVRPTTRDYAHQAFRSIIACTSENCRYLSTQMTNGMVKITMELLQCIALVKQNMVEAL